MPSVAIANLPGSSQVAGDTTPQHVLIVNSSGTPIEAFGGSGGTAAADGAGFTANSTTATPVSGVYESSPTTVTTGKLGIVGITANRELKVSVTSGGTSGTQYTEGDTDVTITGTAMLFESNTGTSALAVPSSAAPLPVTLANTGANATAVKVDGSAVTQPVSGTVTANAGTGTFAVSAASLPLPTGAATAAKQPALGTAGSASADVLTVQGIASMTPLLVNGSGVTQPISGTVTANAGTGTFTISGAVTQSGTWSVRNEDGTGNALTSKVAGSERALSVAIVDGSGAQITTFGGGTQYAEGTTAATITGTALLWEDTSDTLRPASAAKPLPVAIISGAGSGGTASVDDAAFSVGVSSGTPMMGLADETGPDSVDEGDVGVVRMTLARGLHVNLRDTSGAAITTLPVSLASVPSHDVTNAGSFLVQENGAALTALQLIDDGVATIASATPAKGMVAIGTDGTNARALKTDTAGELQVDVLSLPAVTGTVTANLAAGTNNIGDVDVLTINGVAPAFGSGVRGATVQRVTIATDDVVPASQSGTWNIGTVTAVTGITNALPAGTNAIGKLAANSGVDIGDVDVTSVVPGTTATSLGKAEDAAHASGDTGVAILAVRRDTAAVGSGTDGDYSTVNVTASGNVRVSVSEDETAASFYSSLVRGTAAITDGSSTSVIAAAGASVRNYIQGVSIANTSASTVTVDLRDGTAGSVMYTFIAPAGGGVVYSFGEAPLRGTANTAVAADPSAAASTITVSIHGFTGA